MQLKQLKKRMQLPQPNVRVFPQSPDVFSLCAVQDLPFYSKVDKIKIKLFPPPSLPPIFLLTTFATFEAEVGKVR